MTACRNWQRVLRETTWLASTIRSTPITPGFSPTALPPCSPTPSGFFPCCRSVGPGSAGPASSHPGCNCIQRIIFLTRRYRTLRPLPVWWCRPSVWTVGWCSSVIPAISARVSARPWSRALFMSIRLTASRACCPITTRARRISILRPSTQRMPSSATTAFPTATC